MEPRTGRKIIEFPVVKPEERLTNPDARIDHKRLQNIRNYNLTNETRSVKAIVAPPGQAGAGDFSDIQTAIDFVNGDGGGIVFLRNGTYLPTADIEVPSDITLQGESEGAAIIDFNSGAFQIIASGTDAYTTGTVSVTNRSATVTGSGTTWTSSMVGQTIWLSGINYVITAFGSTTSLTIEAAFDGLTASGLTYAIATPISNVLLESFTVQNSTDAEGAILYKYNNGSRIRDISVFDSTVGIKYVECAGVRSAGFTLVGCGTGTNVSGGGGWAFYDFFIFAGTGTGMVYDRLISASIANFTISSNTANGITVTNSTNWGLYDGTIVNNDGKGIEISSSNDIEMQSLTIQSNASDGIKLTSNADRCSMGNGILFQNNGGYGLNIANANCDKNTVVGCSFTGNTSGTISDSGTSTISANNQT